MNLLQRIKSIFQPDPKPAFIAGQLRKPSGSFAKKVAGSMDKVNEPLYDLTLETMNLQDNESILEIGFGSGSFIEKLFQKADRLQVTGIDYSQKMVNLATSVNQSRIFSGQLHLHHGSSDKLPFEDYSFDKIFCNMVIYFWDKPEGHLKEVHRVLKPGGKFYTGFRPRKSMEQLPFTQYDFRLYNEDDWSWILEQNGFSITEISDKTDAPVEHKGEKFEMESVCITAEKKNPGKIQ